MSKQFLDYLDDLSIVLAEGLFDLAALAVVIGSVGAITVAIVVGIYVAFA